MNSSLVWNKTWFYLCSAKVASEHEEGIKISIQNTFVIYSPKNIYHMNHHEKKSKELSLQVLPKSHKVVLQNVKYDLLVICAFVRIQWVL